MMTRTIRRSVFAPFSGGKRRAWLSLVALSLILAAAACGGGGNTPPPPPPPASDVTITPSTLSIAKGATQQFSATVKNETSQLIYWQVNGTTGGDSVHGLISQDGVFIAPPTVPSPATVTLKAVSLLDPTKSGTVSITITAGSNVRVFIPGSGAPITVLTFGQRAFTATVTGAANTAVTWKVNGVTGGSAVTGTISASGVYSAPHSVPVSTRANNDGRTTDVIVTAVSQADASASSSAIVVPLAAQQGHFPLPIPLGTSGGNSLDQSTVSGHTYCCSGTVGSLISRGGKLYILSNNHILARSDLASIGEHIIQPGLVDNNCAVAGTNTVANLSQYFDLETGPLPNVDAAMAEILPGAVDPLGTILQLGGTTNGGQPTDGTPNPGPGVLPTIGRHVAKSGTSTGLTCGTIVSINTTILVDYQKGCNTGSTFTMQYVHQVDIADQGFSAEGDSGSLIVTQDTADPVALLYGGSDADTVGNPVADVLQQLADPNTSEKPVFVGDNSVGPHAVAACSIPQPSPLAAQAVTAEASAAVERELPGAKAVRDARAAELLSRPGVRAVGVGSSYDNPSEAAIVLFVSPGVPRSTLPAEIGGFRTRIVERESFSRTGTLSQAESAALEPSAGPTELAYAVPDDEVERANAAHSARASQLMGRPGIQGVGITSSLDSPGEAALMIFVVRGVPHDPIPPVIDGVRTRVRETSRFRAR